MKSAFCRHIFILWFYVDDHLGFGYVSYLFFPKLYLCVTLIYDGRENISSLVLVRHDRPRSEIYPLWHNRTLACITMINQGKKNYKKKLYGVCSLICITMIRQRVFLLLLNIFALWPVSWWSTKGKCQDGAIWRMLLGLYHNDQPKDKFSSLKYKCSLARITMISQGKISRWRYMENTPWLVSQWPTKGKFSSPKHIRTLVYHDDQARKKCRDENTWDMFLGSYRDD